MTMMQQPYVFMQWTDGRAFEKGFDTNDQREKFVRDSVLNDPRIRSVRFFYKPAPAALLS